MRELKKYPNRRLYDLRDSHYVTCHDVRRMILSGESIKVVDSKDGSDITRSILLLILSEQESDGRDPVLTNRTIEQIIRFGCDAGDRELPHQIERSILAVPRPPREDGGRLESG